jgi:hypothetical protein
MFHLMIIFLNIIKVLMFKMETQRDFYDTRNEILLFVWVSLFRGLNTAP